MATTPVFTFQDVCELLWNMFDPATKPPTGRELRAARNAVIKAYRDLQLSHGWSYYQRRQPIHAEAAYRTGTIAYDHTGGASERLVTLSDGTWPANAARGAMVIDGVHYLVAERLGDTTVTLGANSNPGADIAAGESYLWYRDTYPLPVNFHRARLVGETNSSTSWRELVYRDQASVRSLHMEGYPTTPSDPIWYAIGNDGDYLGAMSLMLVPAPLAATTIDIVYDTHPRALTTYKEATGTVSVSAGATAVTGSGTAFSSAHVGAVIRFTTSTTLEPTGPAGHVDGVTNPFLVQRVITAVASATSLTIDSAVSATTTLTAVKFVISDPIDVEPITMRSVLEAMACAEYAYHQKREDFPMLLARAKDELILAMGYDQRSTASRSGMLEEGHGGYPWGSVDSEPT